MQHNFDASANGFIQPIAPISLRDNAKIAVQVFSSGRFTDLRSVKWHRPIIEPIPAKVPKTLSVYDHLNVDKNRTNLIALKTQQWYNAKYYEKGKKFSPERFDFGEILARKQVHFNSEFTHCRILFQAVSSGKLSS